MYYELALISVAIAGGYWAWFFLRQERARLYGAMLLISAALAGLGLLGRKLDVDALGVAGAVGVGGGTILLIVGPLVRGFARRAAAAERFSLAQALLEIADVLAPGSGVAEEKVLLGAMREIRDGNIERAVDALTAAKDRAPADARLAIDERIAMLYLTAYRWDEAIAHAETHLFSAVPPETRGAGLRSALGIAPPVWVELLGAYGYKGDLDQAARMLARLEDACADREDAAIWLHRGRLVFLALAGRVTAVQTLVQPRKSRHMRPGARAYWLAVAHERHGDRAAAEAAYAKARARSRGKPRELIDQALGRLAESRPAQLGPMASELVARVEAAPPPQVISRRPRGPWATQFLLGAIVAVAAVIALVVGQSNDLGVLIRAGASVRELVNDGEWWRLVSAVMVHVGGVHLAVNALGLWFIGRLTEELFGPARMTAIFGLSGVAGAAASYLASPAGMSAGASGAIFGLLGAVFVELTVHRRRHRAAWSRGMWGGLAIVTLAQVAIGFLYPVIDQWAHVSGLAVGAAAGFVFSPNARWQRAGRRVGRVIAGAFVAACAIAAVMVARTSITDSLTRKPLVRHAVGEVSATAPASWRASASQLFDPDQLVIVTFDRGRHFEDWKQSETKRAKDSDFDQIDVATEHVVPLPTGWQGEELIASAPDPFGDRQRFRIVIAIRGDLVLSLQVPETVARAAPEFFARLIASIN